MDLGVDPVAGAYDRGVVVGAGLLLIYALPEDDRRRVRNGLAIYGVFSLLHLVALGRYWRYVLMLLSALVIGGHSWATAGNRQTNRVTQPPANWATK